MQKPLHIAITSVLFDEKPEGICTGRLIRVLLKCGHRLTVLTSTKQGSQLIHPGLRKVVVSHRPREPRWLFNAIAKLKGDINSNFYMWSKAVARFDFGNDLPDIFYGRAWPHASLVPAYELSRRFDKPLMLHFSDPFPDPPSTQYKHSVFYDDLQRMVDRASVLTFTNQETIDYQGQFIRFDASKAMVLNHVAPKPHYFGEPENKAHFYHLGTITPARPATPLLQGFAQHIKSHPNSKLFFVGRGEKYIQPNIYALGLQGHVTFLPFTNNVDEVIRKAGVLVCIDALIDTPVYTPTKIVDYMVTDRPIFSLTPPNSPVTKLLLRTPETAVVVNDYQADAIAQGLEKILQIKWDRQFYQERIDRMHDFSEEAIAEKLTQTITLLLDKQAV